MKILVTGADGQLASCIKKVCEYSGYNHVENRDFSWDIYRHQKYPFHNEYHFLSRRDLDITSKENIDEVFRAIGPDVVVNCAAYVETNEAEKNPQIPLQVNTGGVINLSNACLEKNAKLVHISTEFVFDGESNSPYKEDDECNPINVYGRTKFYGERIIKDTNPNAIIIRTSWLYSEYGNNFLTKTIRALVSATDSKKQLKFVVDEIGCPTYAIDLAAFIVNMIEKNNLSHCGIFHFTDVGVASRYDFAKEIERLYYSDIVGGTDIIMPCSGDEFNSTIKRPKNSMLDCSLVDKTFYNGKNNGRRPYWRDALKVCISEVKRVY